jgi:hypothetical protein
MVLSSIMVSSVGSMVKPIIDASDYLGISFYPYGDNAAIGLPALPAPPYQWRNPLAWLKTYTTKPIAICETGYTTKNHVVNAGVNINYTGDETMQAIFVRELIQTAKREGYLFVVWFVSIDYEALLAKLPADLAWTKIWVNTGLVTPDLQAKPAFWEWQAWNQ